VGNPQRSHSTPLSRSREPLQHQGLGHSIGRSLAILSRAFLKWGVLPYGWFVSWKIMENPNLKSMMLRGSPISGKLWKASSGSEIPHVNGEHET